MRSPWFLAVFFVATTGVSAHADHDARAKRRHVVEEHVPGTLGVNLGFGMNGFIGAEARQVIGPGVGWEARVTTLDNRHMRAELSYLGSTQELVDDADISLRSHGVQGTLRVNMIPSLVVEPFVYLGVGWSRFTVTRNDNQAFSSPDHILDIPFGIGAAYHLGAFVFDVRAALSIVTGAQIVKPAMDMDGQTSMNRFSIRASVGIEL